MSSPLGTVIASEAVLRLKPSVTLSASEGSFLEILHYTQNDTQVEAGLDAEWATTIAIAHL